MIVLNALIVAGSFAAANPIMVDSTRYPGARDSVAVQATDTIRRRGHAVEYSDWYAKRLTIHRIGSYTMLPLFGAEYILGNQLLHSRDEQSGVKATHVAVATGIGALFT